MISIRRSHDPESDGKQRGDGKTSRSPGNHPTRGSSGISGLGDPITGRGVAGPWGARDDEPRSEKRPSASEPCSERPTSRVRARVAPRSRSVPRRRTRPHGVSIAREERARADARWRAALKPNLSSGGKDISSGKAAGPDTAVDFVTELPLTVQATFVRYRLRLGGAMTHCSVITVRPLPRGKQAADGWGSGVRACLTGSVPPRQERPDLCGVAWSSFERNRYEMNYNMAESFC